MQFNEPNPLLCGYWHFHSDFCFCFCLSSYRYSNEHAPSQIWKWTLVIFIFFVDIFDCNCTCCVFTLHNISFLKFIVFRLTNTSIKINKINNCIVLIYFSKHSIHLFISYRVNHTYIGNQYLNFVLHLLCSTFLSSIHCLVFCDLETIYLTYFNNVYSSFCFAVWLRCFVQGKPHNFRVWMKITLEIAVIYLFNEWNAYKSLYNVQNSPHKYKDTTFSRQQIPRHTFLRFFVYIIHCLIFCCTVCTVYIFCLCFHWFYRTLYSMLFSFRDKPAIRVDVIGPPK